MNLENISPEFEIDDDEADLIRRLSEGDNEAYGLLVLGEERAIEEGFIQDNRNLSQKRDKRKTTRRNSSRISNEHYSSFLERIGPYLNLGAREGEEDLRGILKEYFPKRYKLQSLEHVTPEKLWAIANHIASYARDRTKE